MFGTAAAAHDNARKTYAIYDMKRTHMEEYYRSRHLLRLLKSVSLCHRSVTSQVAIHSTSSAKNYDAIHCNTTECLSDRIFTKLDDFIETSTLYITYQLRHSQGPTEDPLRRRRFVGILCITNHSTQVYTDSKELRIYSNQPLW